LCDGSLSAEIASLLQGIAFGEQRVRGRSHTLHGRRGAGQAIPAPEPIKPLGAEQSNTSFVFESRLVGKLLRRVEPGGSLEVEVLQALDGVAPRPNVPRLEAHIEVKAGQGTGTLWVSESFVPNEGAAWQLTIDHAQRFYEDALTGRHGDAPVPAPSWFDGPQADLELDFAPLARLLGRRTAELHAALFESSRGETAPKAFNALSSRAFYQSVRNLSARAFDALRIAPLTERAARLAREVVSRKADLRRILDKALSPPLSGLRMRVHGDYHLGQVLYTGSDFYIIDFEGEPGRTPRERRRLRSPLADVAGMLRSFHYAAYGALTMRVPGARIRPEDAQQLEPWARHFFDACVHEFLSSYLTHAERGAFLGGTPAQLRTLLEIHVLEKATYELLYELNARPDWAELPLRGLLALLPADQRTDQPSSTR
jgi:maltose alpha-D-glucosyltransferase / alpha-amylase